MKPWYQNPWIIGIATTAALIWGASALSAPSPTHPITPVQKASYSVQPTVKEIPVVSKAVERETSVQQGTELSNDNYYTNVDGNSVHSPAYTEDNSVPAGASARCKDGTYSFSQHRSGTCSHHGGVARWL
ncbi:MAG: hypothetical protein Greene07147_681 [Parcubacteria group bacterium Greene0714_7]|nr:MAG: hypothetical protein Greene07147_681 [Parcubacteria group bacterium Greene0714_7]